MKDGKERTVAESYSAVAVAIVTFPTEDNGRLLMLQRALKSVESQALNGFTDFEVYIIDDGSPLQAECFEVAKAWGTDMFDKYGVNVGFKGLDKNTGGQGYGFNWVMMMAQAPLIAYLDDDDEWDHNYLATMVPALVGPGTDFAYARWRVDTTQPCPEGYKEYLVDGDMAEMPWIEHTGHMLSERGAPRNFMSPVFSVHSIGAAVMQCLYPTGILWNDTVQRFNDFEFFSRWERQGCRFTGINKALGQVHFHGGNITTRPMEKDEADINKGKLVKGVQAWRDVRQSCSDLVQAVSTH